MIRRVIGILWLLLGTLAVTGELRGIAFPTARWFFNASRELAFLNYKPEEGAPVFWFGWLSSALLILAGALLVWRSFTAGPPNPMTLRKL
ncbi:MAG TPA: hypothetical protein VLO11_07915, partial [Luteolibacter sp.]|nr:hypothetical protein [Luteolibacter sp.]